MSRRLLSNHNCTTMSNPSSLQTTALRASAPGASSLKDTQVIEIAFNALKKPEFNATFPDGKVTAEQEIKFMDTVRDGHLLASEAFLFLTSHSSFLFAFFLF